MKINQFPLRLPAKYYRYFPANYESQNFKFLMDELKPGMVCVDIGAHIGLFTTYMAAQTKGKVHSFEPTPSSLEVLNDTVRINGLSNFVTIVPAAVSDKRGKTTFFISDMEASVINSMVDVDLGAGNQRKGYEVDVISVDEYAKDNNLKIDFLKIDAEGVELQVLEGAEHTFRQNRPKAILGLHPFAYQDRTKNLHAIWDKLESFNMKVLEDGSLISKEQFCSREKIFDVQLLPR